MKDFLGNIKSFMSNNKQKVMLFGSVGLVMLILIIAIAVIMHFVTYKISYEMLEDRLEKATVNYLKDFPEKMPSATNPTVVISATELIEKEYIKELKKLVKDASCTANVLVDYGEKENTYQAYLTCNTFKTEKFVDVLKKSNTISQTGEGLYEMNGELIFRGQNPHNYVSFANRLWRIVKMNKDGNLQMIVLSTKMEINSAWDDRYNSEKDSQRGINNFLLSRSFSTLKDFYQANLKEYEPLLTTYDLCVGKRLASSTEKSGSLECSELIKEQSIGLLPLYDYMNASLDGLCQTTISKECQNYNYLADNKSKWWTMTADMETTYDTFYVNGRGQVESNYASNTGENRFVVALSSDALYKSGTGTMDDPYIVR